MSRTEHDLRCHSDGTILGKYGVDERGLPYVHIKAWKQQRLIAEFIATSGVVHVRCRKCRQWHRVNIRGRVPSSFVAEDLPRQIPVP